MTTAPSRSASRLSVLPQDWRTAAAGALPNLAHEIGERIHQEIAEYGADATGVAPSDIARFVQPALRAFMQSLAEGRPLTSEQADLFRKLGRIEAEAGRSHDVLQAAYRVASQAVMHQLLDWERRFRTPRQTVTQISSAVFTFIDDLARLSAEGFDSAANDRTGAARSRSRLLGQIVDGAPLGEVRRSATTLGWAMPEQCNVVEATSSEPLVAAEFSDLAARAFGPATLAGLYRRRYLAVATGPLDVAVMRAALGGRDIRIVVGPRVALADAGASERLARRCAELPHVAAALSGVFLCTDHLLDLVLAGAADLAGPLAVHRLQPLLELSPVKRLKYARLLSAWLEFGSLHGDAPGVLDKPRQTLRYQTTRLEQLFGAQLRERRSRLEITLALRCMLPVWERDVPAHTDVD